MRLLQVLLLWGLQLCMLLLHVLLTCVVAAYADVAYFFICAVAFAPASLSIIAPASLSIFANN